MKITQICPENRTNFYDGPGGAAGVQSCEAAIAIAQGSERQWEGHKIFPVLRSHRKECGCDYR
eukprot:2986836-Rhodomonas_salina.2